MPAIKKPKDYVSVFEELGFVPVGDRDREAYGTCPFCQKENKFHVNRDTGLYSCKSGACASEGNVYTFLSEFYNVCVNDEPDASLWEEISRDRSLPVSALRAAGVAYDSEDERWIIPARNPKGSIVNLYHYRVGGTKIGPNLINRVISLPFLEPAMFGAEQIADAKTVWICEGPWDMIAARTMLADACDKAVVKDPKIAVVAVPGATVFPDKWEDWFINKDVITAYDNDDDGKRARRKQYKRLHDIVERYQVVRWPEEAKPKTDIRDMYVQGMDWDTLNGLVGDLVNGQGNGNDAAQDRKNPVDMMPLISKGERPRLRDTMAVYKRHFAMNQDMRDGLRVIFAVVMSNQIKGEPLWIHIASPPGGGKTMLLTSTATCAQVMFRSSLSGATLVSGFKGEKGKDPSLIPKLIGKTFVLKDMTEIIRAPMVVKQLVYSTLRGAYDGRVERDFGNAVSRVYDGYFSMVTGVTQAIFGEDMAELGERFLIFHMAHDVEADHRSAIMSALEGANTSEEAKADVMDAAREFLEYQIDVWPEISHKHRLQLVSLSQIVALLRGSVDYRKGTDRLSYRPETEIGTRVAKQLQLLLMCLGAQRYPVKITEDDWRIVVRTAMDSCIGWNMDAIRILAENDGWTAKSIAIRARAPFTTIREQLDELELLKVLRKETVENPGRGPNIVRYWLSDLIRQYWRDAGFPLSESGSGEPLSWEETPVTIMSHNGIEPFINGTKTVERLRKKHLRGVSLRPQRRKKTAPPGGDGQCGE